MLRTCGTRQYVTAGRARPACSRTRLATPARLLAAAVTLAFAPGLVAQTTVPGFHESLSGRAAVGDVGWPVPLIAKPAGQDRHASAGFLRWFTADETGAGAAEVRLDESDGTLEPLVRTERDPRHVLEWPMPAEDPELDLVGWPGIRLPSLGLPRFFGRLRGEYADDFDDQSRIGGSAHLRTSPVFGFDLEWHYRRNDLPRSRHDKLWTGDANVVYQLVNVKMISMRAGGGVAWLVDEDEGEAGFNLTYGADFFVRRPWMMTVEVDFGRIGGDSLSHARGTFGYVMGQWEVYTGWDWFELGDRAFDGVIGGVTLWF